jgi:hypothetical protein
MHEVCTESVTGHLRPLIYDVALTLGCRFDLLQRSFARRSEPGSL